MKKTLLTLFLGSMLCANAQTVVWSDDFDDEDISDWTLVDSDGDGFDWAAVQIIDEDDLPVGTPLLRSASWVQPDNPLTPNNWAISPVIDLSTYAPGSTITLNWEVMAIDAAWDVEKYSVYAAASDATATLLASPVKVTENSLNGVNTLTARTLDLSSLAGQSAVYVAFRHWGVTNQFTMEIDNVSVTGTLGTDSFFSNNFRMYPNPASSVINLASTTTQLQSAQITDINGRVVKNVSLNGVSETQINIADLNTGMYFLKVQSDLGTGTTKVIKN